MIDRDQIAEYKNGLLQGDIRMLAKAITLIESQRHSDQDKKTQLLHTIQDIRKPAVRIGITGSPGVGKSTFLNAFISFFRGSQGRVAVLTIDPSSTQTGGSILGDKLRMKDLADMENVYIRPSPSKGTLGGVSLTTWETVQLCEAAGFDYIFVETVGVGQSEMEVQHLVNEVWYLTMARSGDEIQGIKRGILEIVKRIIVTKTDLDPYGAQKAKAMLQQTLQSSKGEEQKISFYEVSALQPDSLRPLHNVLTEIQAKPFSEAQKNYWFDRGWRETFLRFIDNNPAFIKSHKILKDEVSSGRTDHWTAMEKLKKELEEEWGK